MMVQHHVKYREIHGVDEVVMMEFEEHRLLHIRLRSGGKCKISSAELTKISQAAHHRTVLGRLYDSEYRKTEKCKLSSRNYYKNKIQQFIFSESMLPSVLFVEYVRYNLVSGNISCTFQFRANGGKRLLFIDI